MERPRVNAQYNVAAPDSLPVRIAAYQRRRMFDVFLKTFHLPHPDATLLDIGVTSDQSYQGSNYLEAWYPHKHQVVAAGLDDARFLEILYPGVRFVAANALSLPFADRSFDYVHASAVIEHVGSRDNQHQMLRECARVCRRGFMVTTPNRWFPVEVHTLLPLVHWLPDRVFRAVLRATGRDFFANIDNLNLLSSSDLLEGARRVIPDMSLELAVAKLLAWPSNLMLIGRRDRLD